MSLVVYKSDRRHCSGAPREGREAALRSRSTVLIEARGPPNMATHTPHAVHPMNCCASAVGSSWVAATVAAFSEPEMAACGAMEACGERYLRGDIAMSACIPRVAI